MLTTDQYPMVLKSDGCRARPRQVEPLTNGLWRVDWSGGLVSLYRDDPRAHLRLGYDPKHLGHLATAPPADRRRRVRSPVLLDRPWAATQSKRAA
jgi:hypothetical protein